MPPVGPTIVNKEFEFIHVLYIYAQLFFLYMFLIFNILYYL